MQRGFTLVEVVVTLAVVALLLAAGGAFSLGTRPYAVRAAQSQFDALLRTARALASTSGNGATIVVEPRNANGSAAGFTATLYGGRPNAVPLASQNVPPLVVDANFAETSLGAPPLSIFLSSAGRATMLGGYPDRAHFDTPAVPAIATEPQTCPASGSYTLTFSAGGGNATLPLPC